MLRERKRLRSDTEHGAFERLLATRGHALTNFVACMAVLVSDPGGVGGIPEAAARQNASTLCHSGSGGVGGIPKLLSGQAFQLQSVFGSMATCDPGSVGGIPIAGPAHRAGSAGGGPNGVGGIPFAGDLGSAGGIPHSVDPGGAGGIPASVHFAPTAGLILDSTNAPISGAPILVLSCDGTPIAATTTDELGAFALTLPKVAGLTLVLPTLGVDDVPVVAGHPLLIIVP